MTLMAKLVISENIIVFWVLFCKFLLLSCKHQTKGMLRKTSLTLKPQLTLNVLPDKFWALRWSIQLFAVFKTRYKDHKIVRSWKSKICIFRLWCPKSVDFDGCHLITAGINLWCAHFSQMELW